VITQRSGKRDLFFGGKARGLNVGCTEFLSNWPARRSTMACLSASVASVTVAKRGPSQTVDTQKARAQRDALFRAERGRILVPEYKGAGNSPFAGYGRPLEHKCVRRVEPDRRGNFSMPASSGFRTARARIIPNYPGERIHKTGAVGRPAAGWRAHQEVAN